MGQWPENRLQAFMPMDDLEDVRELNFTDIRGFRILNTTGHPVGSVKEVFVDPNTLGGYAIILGFMCLFMINAEGNDPWWFKLVKYAGFLAGIYLSIGSGTRGSWIAAPPLLLLWIALHWRGANKFGLIGLAAVPAAPIT